MARLSRFAHVYDKGETHYALFHSIKLSTIFLGQQSASLIGRLKEGVDIEVLSPAEKDLVANLSSLGYVGESNADKTELERVKTSLEPRLTLMYLILTDRCNLQCKYCFIEAGFPQDYVCNDMTWGTAKKAIDLFLDQRDTDYPGEIWLYGGEPLLNAEVFFHCLDYINETDPSIQMVVISNGTILTRDIADRMAKYPNLNVSISLDGPKAIHDQMRVDRSGKGSFDRAVAGIANLRKAGKDFGISCTLAEHNVNMVVEVAEWANRELGTDMIGVNFLVDTPKAFVSEEYIRTANNGLIEFFDRSRDSSVYESRIMRKIKAFVKGEPRWHDCSACGKQIVISPTGEIGICHEGLGERRTFIGSLDENFNFLTNPLVHEWAYRSPATMPECIDCPALGMCGGGCPYGAMLRYGSIHEVDRRFCIHSKDTLEWLVWDLYYKMMTRVGAS
jgi:uncharacterized protein